MKQKLILLTTCIFVFLLACKRGDDHIPPIEKGKVSFWAKRSCNNGSGVIVFSIDNKIDSIVAFGAKAPTCDQPGAKKMQLPVGKYSWKAICSSDTLVGEVVVDKNQCTLVEIDFPEYPVVDTEYINFKVNNIQGFFKTPQDSIIEADYYTNSTSLMFLSSYNGGFENWYGILFSGPASATGIHIAKQVKLPGITAGMSDTLKVNITEYGNIGEAIVGNLKGKIRDDASSTISDIEMDFRIIRRK